MIRTFLLIFTADCHSSIHKFLEISQCTGSSNTVTAVFCSDDRFFSIFFEVLTYKTSLKNRNNSSYFHIMWNAFQLLFSHSYFPDFLDFPHLVFSRLEVCFELFSWSIHLVSMHTVDF